MIYIATAHEIETDLCGIVAESLAIERVKVEPTASLMNDLGAGSLDFLDIVFQLERRYHIQITRSELERSARGDMSEQEFAPDGVISEAGLVRLRQLLPEAAERIQPGLYPTQILGLFSVSTLVRLVLDKQHQLESDG